MTAALAVVVVSCSSPRVCTPGETRLCAGPANCSGTRTCDSAGTAFSECTCGAAGGSGTAGGSSGGGAGGSAGAAIPDGGTTPDAGPADAGCPLPCGGGCCRYKQLCGADGGCYSDYDVDRRPYCEPCSSGGGVDTCGTGSNFCLVGDPAGNFFCGADCSQGQSCPAGYACQDIRVVYTRWVCSASGLACAVNPSLPCQRPQDCPRGGACVIPAGQTIGQCSGQCVLGEGQSQGFCSCLVDSDCAQQSCTGGECSISRGSCVTEQDCRPIRCVDMPTPDGGRIGACLIGQNCAPASGLTCAEVG